MMEQIVVCGFLLVGTFFMLTGSIGLVRMPDLYCRMHAASKCITLGISALLIAVMLNLHTYEVMVKGGFAIFFQFLTTPVSAHMIARAAYRHLGVSFWANTFVHEWKDWYDE